MIEVLIMFSVAIVPLFLTGVICQLFKGFRYFNESTEMSLIVGILIAMSILIQVFFKILIS